MENKLSPRKCSHALFSGYNKVHVKVRSTLTKTYIRPCEISDALNKQIIFCWISIQQNESARKDSVNLNNGISKAVQKIRCTLRTNHFCWISIQQNESAREGSVNLL